MQPASWTDLTVAIITHNEEHNLPECLDSVKWAGQVVVVDSFSTDGSVEVCRRRGARVFQEPWKGYAAQKNSALDKAERPWVLSLDADERVSPELVTEIDRVLTSRNHEAGYSVPRRNHFAGRWIRHGGWSPDRVLRLFLRDRARFEERAVHEKAVVDGPVGRLTHPLLHFTYTNISDFLTRSDHYSTLSAEEYFRAGKKIGPAGMLGHAFFTFVQMYFMKAGFLDGYYGFLLACLYSHYTFCKYAKLRERSLGRSSGGHSEQG